MSEAGDKSRSHGITGDEHDRNRRGCALGRKRCLGAKCDDHAYLELHQISREIREPFEPSLRVPRLEREIPTRRPAQIAQPLQKYLPAARRYLVKDGAS